VNAQTVEKQKMPPGLVLAAVVLLALVLVAVVIMRDKEPAEPKSTPAPAPRGKGKVPAAGDAPGEPSQSAPDGGTDG
jgi:hypothetical protein